MEDLANPILKKLAHAYIPATAEAALAYLHAMEIVCEVARLDKDAAIDSAIVAAQAERKPVNPQPQS